MSLIKDLLVRLEEVPMPWGAGAFIKLGPGGIEIPGYTTDQINFHFALLRSAGFIDFATIEPSTVTSIRFRGLTWAGHDFLDGLRDSEFWEGSKMGRPATIPRGGRAVIRLRYASSCEAWRRKNAFVHGDLPAREATRGASMVIPQNTCLQASATRGWR